MLLQYLVAALAPTVALAAIPIGCGPWTRVHPDSYIQPCGGGSVDGNVFHLPSQPDGSTDGPGCSSGHLRAEERVRNDYSSGVHQFSGQFTIQSFGGDRVSLKQTFHGDEGAWFMMAVEQSGRLYNVHDQETIAYEGVAAVGETVQVNTVHDLDAGEITVYINGEEKYTTSSPDGSFYDKYGAYATNSGSGPMEVTWSDVAFWRR